MPSAPRVSQIPKSEVFWPFIPDSMTPEQFADVNYASKIKPTPERTLMLAVLEKALADLCRYMCQFDAKQRMSMWRFRELQEWFKNKDSSWLYSFEHICETVGFDPDYFRRCLADTINDPWEFQTRLTVRVVSDSHRVSIARDRSTRRHKSKYTASFTG